MDNTNGGLAVTGTAKEVAENNSESIAVATIQEKAKIPCNDGGSITLDVIFDKFIAKLDFLRRARSSLKPCQWLVVNGIADFDSFDAAARFNILNNGWTNYKSISERNDWYKWANNIALKKNNYWFAAAVEVTSWRAVGSADKPNLAYVTDPEEYFMRYINTELLKRNFQNFGPYLLSNNACVKWGATTYCDLTGLELEKQMVVIEQSEVENIIPIAKAAFHTKFGTASKFCVATGGINTPWECAIWGINRVSDGTCNACILADLVVKAMNGFNLDALGRAMNEFKNKNKEKYNFLNINHRIFIGQAMAKYLRLEN